ncbi:MAG: serine/threonine protein kinase [Alphaproteobacteria bacterium]|nr:serine/threonine protein kinase [Alphaproteobacteria bacterium]
MISQVIDGINFKLREYQDFSWLNDYGTVFSVIDETGSGCISFGIKKDNKKYFFKIAGAKTVNAEISEEESIKLLKEAVIKYKDIKNDNLIKLVDAFEYKDFYVVIYEYAEGECLFDHWNFDRYEKTKEITPLMKFKSLPVEKRLKVADKLFSFFESFIDAGYVAVDFYDSSIIYDFDNDEVTFCDIDLFRKMPTVNDLGTGYFGTKRLKAPEENELGAPIDEQTSLFTLGAIIFDMFSHISNTEERYNKGCFIPNKLEEFELNKNVYDVLLKATAYDKNDRYKTVKEFKDDFYKNINS